MEQIDNNFDQVAELPARIMSYWLLSLGLLVYAMILVGGMTRLTDSGLSITDWQLIMGSLPPLSQANWLELFEKYQQTAEYKYQNFGMTLDEFKAIFWPEWAHRVFGRLIGLVAIIGLAVFAIKKWLTRGLWIRFLILIALGGLQGAIGWWMVASGIGETNRVDVAPYRLMTHFSLALFIIALIFWFWLDIRQPARQNTGSTSKLDSIIMACLLIGVSLQMAAGALVAGLDAGRTYTDWPLMAGEAIPSAYWVEVLGWRNPFENVTAAQFHHRMLAYILLIISIIAAIWRQKTLVVKVYRMILALIILQSLWGIFTLILAAPMNLALIHQALGVLVMLSCVYGCWRVRLGKST